MYQFNPIYYNTLDQIYHANWASQQLIRFEILKQSIHKLFPNGHPTQLIQVAGTNGKGSVCRYLEAGFSLRYQSASFNSPHLFDYRERFSIQGQQPAQEDIIEAWENKVKPLCLELALRGENYVHEFHEINILIALILFEKYGVEWAAIETGCGGYYDQTTALEVQASVITNVGQDHEAFLGKEQWQRAIQKAGVCRTHKPTFTSVIEPEAFSVIQFICHSLDSLLYPITLEEVREFQQSLAEIYPQNQYQNRLIQGEHQLWNATLSLKVIQHFLPELKREDIITKFAEVQFTGRLQHWGNGIYIDIAHNPDKIQALVTEVGQRFPNCSKTFIIGLSGQRSPQEIFVSILQVADQIILTSVPAWKGVAPELILEELKPINSRRIPIQVIADPKQALDVAKTGQGEGDMIILTGSTYLIDQALNPDPYIRYINATYGWRK